MTSRALHRGLYALAWLVCLLSAARASAAIKTQTVEYREGDAVLEGYLAYDDAVVETRRDIGGIAPKPPVPGVLVAHEWWGLNDYIKRRTEQLAGLGYVAFAADIYGKGRRATTPEEAGKLAGEFRNDRAKLRARMNAALDTLKAQPGVDPHRLAAIGYCFGGTAALELARSGAAVAGVVSFHGGLDNPKPEDAKNIKAKVLVLHGGDDPMVPPDQVAAFEDEMRKAGVDWTLVAYGGAVHAFTNPDADKVGLKGVKYHAAADRRSWEAMRAFFGETLAVKA